LALTQPWDDWYKCKKLILGSYRQVSILENNAEIDGQHNNFTSLACKAEASKYLKNRIIPMTKGIHIESKQNIDHLSQFWTLSIVLPFI
jgi:hypothetical protein